MGKLDCLMIDIVSKVKHTLMSSPPLRRSFFFFFFYLLFARRSGSLAQETWPESER